MRKLKKFIGILLIVAIVVQNNKVSVCHAVDLWTYPSLTEEQNYIFAKIYEVCKNNWKEYGVLPSVCMTQAFIESTIGEHRCGTYNLWGITSSSSDSGYANYNSLEDGIIGYLKVINNGSYPKAPFCKEANYQLRYILDGGYCYPENDYYSKGLQIMGKYGLTSFDELMFEELENSESKLNEEERKKKEEEKIKKEKKLQEKLKKEQEELLKKQREEAEEKYRQEQEAKRQEKIKSEKSKQMIIMNSIQKKANYLKFLNFNKFNINQVIQEYCLLTQSKIKVMELENPQQENAAMPNDNEGLLIPSPTPVVFQSK